MRPKQTLGLVLIVLGACVATLTGTCVVIVGLHPVSRDAIVTGVIFILLGLAMVVFGLLLLLDVL